MEDKLFKAMALIADVKEAIGNNQPEYSADICDSVSGAMICIDQIRIVASRYSDACFTEADAENEDYMIFRLLTSLASEARRRLKIAEKEILN